MFHLTIFFPANREGSTPRDLATSLELIPESFKMPKSDNYQKPKMPERIQTSESGNYLNREKVDVTPETFKKTEPDYSSLEVVQQTSESGKYLNPKIVELLPITSLEKFRRSKRKTNSPPIESCDRNLLSSAIKNLGKYVSQPVFFNNFEIEVDAEECDKLLSLNMNELSIKLGSLISRSEYKKTIRMIRQELTGSEFDIYPIRICFGYRNNGNQTTLKSVFIIKAGFDLEFMVPVSIDVEVFKPEPKVRKYERSEPNKPPQCCALGCHYATGASVKKRSAFPFRDDSIPIIQ